MSFKRTKEDFTCENCGAEVVGDGYTDHCSVCLWSKHVDVDPGDREATCGGMMEPWDIEPKASGFRVISRCTICGFERPSPIKTTDNIEAFAQLAKKAAKRKEDSLR
jgi:RNHCP domain